MSYEGATDLVRSLTVPFCVASSGPRDRIELSLRVTGLLPYFEDRIFSSYELGSWKPDPGLFVHAARSLRADPTRCAVVEDSVPGVQAGIAAGMTVFALTNDLPAPAFLAPVTRIRQLKELIPIFAQSHVT